MSVIFHFALALPPSFTVHEAPACNRQFDKARERWSLVNEPVNASLPLAFSLMALLLIVPLSIPPRRKTRF